ncbi:MAG: zinc ribbon domain-containing protein [Bilophila sp.]
MPMYDFHCSACSHDFEEMATGDSCPVCPSCGSPHTERQLSAPNLKTGAAPFKAGPIRPIAPHLPGKSPCGGCGGSCGA